MRIAMFGGTYDPIHYGHIALARNYVDCLTLDKIYIIPTRTPPHKAATATDGQLRLEMCRLALEELHDSRYEASDIELKREGLSWSYYTVCALLGRHPGAELFLLVGADMFMTMETWHRFDELKELVTICTVPRDENTREVLCGYAERLEGLGCRTVVADAFEPVYISSTMIRNNIAEGKSIEGLTPPAVIELIKRHGLYLRSDK